MTKYKKGKIVTGTVSGIEKYGIFVSFDEYYSGLIHISEVSHGFVKDVHDFAKIGDNITAEIIDVDEKASHLTLSIKNINHVSLKPKKKMKIIETRHGFDTLAHNLPLWIDKKLKNMQKGVK